MNKVGLSIFIPWIAASSAFLTLTFTAIKEPHPYGLAPVMLGILFSISLYFLCVDITQKALHPLRIAFSLYFSFFFSLPGFLQMLWYGFPFYGMTYPREIAEAGSIVSLLCALTVYSAYYFYWRKSRSSSFATESLTPICEPTPVYLCFFFMALSLTCATLVGWGAMLSDRGERETVSTGNLILTTIAHSASFVAFLHASVWRGSRLRRLGLGAISFLCFFATNPPLAIPRFQLAAYAFSFFLAHSRFTRRDRAFFCISVVGGILTVFPAISILSRKGGDLRDFFNGGVLTYYGSSGDFDGFQSVLSVMRYVDATGFKLGINILSAAFVFVPRSLWPSKSPGTGADAAEYLGFAFTNLSAPLPAELWVDFGYLGVFLGGAIVGALLFKGDTTFSNPNSSIHRRLLWSVIFGFIIILLRGSLVAVVAPIGLTILLFILLAFLSRITLSRY